MTRTLHLLQLLIFSAVFSFSSLGQMHLPKIALTDSAKLSLLTCSQGEELYSVFGHSAIRVSDPLVGIDWVFNYGTFDFSDPDFYPNFVKGKLNYILSVSSYKNFEYTYIYEGRYIYEHILNLHLHEKQKLLDSLRINFLPENRYYLYDFLFDNCATRIRDIIVQTLPREIDFNYSVLDRGRSFRELLMPNVVEKPWAKLGINLLLGVSADREAQPWEYMFLPEHMMTAFANASFVEESTIIPFAQESIILLKGKEIPKCKFRDAPLFTFLIVLLLSVLVTYVNIKRGRKFWWFDRLLFGLVGFLGVVIAFQWFGSDHIIMGNNYNLIWTHPIHIIAAILLTVKRFRRSIKLYFGINAIILMLLMIFWFVLPQTLPFAMFPIVAAMAIRSVIIYKNIG